MPNVADRIVQTLEAANVQRIYGSCGPGNLHLINGLFDCQRNRVPVLAIAAHIPSTEIGSQYFQETHPQSLFKECSHYVELISDPAQVPRIVETAIREAIAKQGVAVIVISGDVALKEAGPELPSSKPVSRLPRVCPAPPDIEDLVHFLEDFADAPKVVYSSSTRPDASDPGARRTAVARRFGL